MRKQLLRMAILVIMPLTVFAQSQELCEGDAVTTSDHLNATIKQVFPDGVVKVTINGYTYTYNINQLSKPISCLNNICAGDSVTTSDHLNATIKQVFPDGVVKVTINGYTYTYNINQLSKPISCLNNICAGDSVTTSDHLNATVKQVFPDGVVKVTINGYTYTYNISQLALYKKCSQSGGTSCRQ